MTADEILGANLFKIVDVARYAPSVHNTQPWKVKKSKNIITISLDKTNRLIDGDPTGRESFISLGIFSEAFILVAKSYNLSAVRIKINNDEVQIAFKEFSDNSTHRKYERLIKNRTSDRSIYNKARLREKFIESLYSVSVSKRVEIRILSDSESIDKVAKLTSQGIGLALSNPKFRKELSKFLIHPWSKQLRGIPVKSLRIPWFVAQLEPFLIKAGVGLKSEVKLEKSRWESASAIVLITTIGDLQDDWFSAGRAYLKVSTLIEEEGLSQATSAAIVEASNFHEDIEKMIHTKKRLQCVIRLGKGSSKKVYSPRVSPEELIIT